MLKETHSVNARQLALDRASAVDLIRDAGGILRKGIEERDAAIRAGAVGAYTLVYRGARLVDSGIE